jgi:signal transduction histidine kinase
MEMTVYGQTLNRDKDFLIEIQDTGISVPDDQLPHIFEPFYRGVRDQKGSGLGLSIAKKTVDAHGRNFASFFKSFPRCEFRCLFGFNSYREREKHLMAPKSKS